VLIDWFTVGAQALNFLILVWLMKRFLYKPILHAIDEREKRISTQLKDADKRKAEAKTESEEFQKKSELFDQQRTVLMEKARDDVKIERQRLLDEARKVASDLTLKQQEALKTEEDKFREAIGQKTQQEVFTISRKALFDLAGANLEERMVEIFCHRLAELSASSIQSIQGSSADPVIVQTAFELTPALRTSVEAEIKKILGADRQVKFNLRSNLMSGIELTVKGQRVSWSLSGYMSALENKIDEKGP
jgi:F-type H+-transporting ATPase subunit b